MTEVANSTAFLIPALNGTLINGNDCSNTICSSRYGEVLYIPSLPGNAIYLSIFGIFLCVQFCLGIQYRTWGFMTGMLCGLVMEIIGYSGRLDLYADDFQFSAFVTYLVCLTTGPAFISASIYLCISRLAVVYGRDISRFAPRTYTATFVICDFVSLALQAVGGALAATGAPGASTKQTGINIMIAGLVWQVVSLILFIILSIDLLLSASRAGLLQSRSHSGFFLALFPWALIFASVVIFVRCCFRVAELKDGFGSSLANNQAAFMILEGLMMMLAVLALTLFHPGTSFGGRKEWQSASWTWRSTATGSGASSVEMTHVKRTPKVMQSV